MTEMASDNKTKSLQGKIDPTVTKRFLRSSLQNIAPQPESPLECAPGPGPKIELILNNMTCSFNVGCPLNLQHIAMNHNGQYRKMANSVILAFKIPRRKAFVYASGKICMMGTSTEDEVLTGARQCFGLLKKLGYPAKFLDYRITSVFAGCKMPFAIKIIDFAKAHPKFVSYEPELQPGCLYKMNDINATLIIFWTGSVQVAARDVNSANSAAERAYYLTYDFRTEHPTPLPMSRAKGAIAKRRRKPSTRGLPKKNTKTDDIDDSDNDNKWTRDRLRKRTKLSQVDDLKNDRSKAGRKEDSTELGQCRCQCRCDLNNQRGYDPEQNDLHENDQDAQKQDDVTQDNQTQYDLNQVDVNQDGQEQEDDGNNVKDDDKNSTDFRRKAIDNAKNRNSTGSGHNTNDNANNQNSTGSGQDANDNANSSKENDDNDNTTTEVSYSDSLLDELAELDYSFNFPMPTVCTNVNVPSQVSSYIQDVEEEFWNASNYDFQSLIDEYEEHYDFQGTIFAQEFLDE